MQRRITSLLVALTLLSSSGCSVNPATGEQTFTAFMSPQEEQQVGDQEHPKLVQEFGGAYKDPELAAYVDRVGQSVAKNTEIPGIHYSYTVLNDELVNAFALPGGYVHVTRGLLALASSEAEIASVLGHETGHITARHTAQRYSQGVLAGIGAGIVGIAGAMAGLGSLGGDLAGFGAQAYLQGYSRDQELEADKLGLRYMTRANYDPQAMVSFFRKLDAFTHLQATMAGDPEAADQFSIMASHPRTAERVQQAMQLANISTPPSPREGEDEYLSKIDGMIFGDSPEEGVRRGREFLHPGLRIAFRVPPGFVMFNSSKELTARGPSGSGMSFDAEPNVNITGRVPDMATYLVQVWGKNLSLQNVRTGTANGMQTASGQARVKLRSGAVADLYMGVVRASEDRIYRFLFIIPTNISGSVIPQANTTLASFRRLSADEAAQITPLRVKVVTVKAGDTAESLSASMPFESYRLEMFLALNGLNRGQPLTPGSKVKVIVG